jgi:DNA-binding response OmpR family regulator
MPHKVLVFESDSAFAIELRNELAKLDCNTVIVDDGNVGLQQAAADKPDLILLSIELPRMNGFSVCNKLKKDANLRDVPLIIMSSESSGETFEQHRKLRTRAEDYVHKPIAFGELLQHIRAFVPLGGGGDGGGVDIDDEVHERGNTFPPAQQREGGSAGRNTGRTSVLQSSPKEIDPDIDQFADEAFGMLQSGSNPGTDLSSLASEHEAEAQQRAREELTGSGSTPDRTGLTQMHADVHAPPHELPGEEPRTMYHAQANVNPYGANDPPPEPVESTPGTRGAVTAENVRAQPDDDGHDDGRDEAAEQLRAELEDAHRKSESLERELGTARSDLGRVQDEMGQLRQELEASREAIGSLERGQEERAAKMQAAASDATSAAAATSAQSSLEITRLPR